MWFYFHCVLFIVILVADAKGTLEPTLKKWEKKIGVPVTEQVEGKNGDEKKEGL